MKQNEGTDPSPSNPFSAFPQGQGISTAGWWSGKPGGNNFYSGFVGRSGGGDGGADGSGGGGGGNVPVRRATDVNGYYSDGTPSFQATPLGQILGAVGDVLGKIINIPNDIIGLGVGLAGLPFGGEHWNFNHGALEITGNKLVSSAITIGGIINYGGTPPNSPDYPNRSHLTWEHEVQHIPQGEVLGPFYLIAHLIGGIAGSIDNGNWHGPANFMETGPMGTPPTPWGH